MLRLFPMLLTIILVVNSANAAEPPPAIKVSENGRFLFTTDNKPFFWLADTAWEIFHRLNREDVDRYLDKRAKQGFTVIQAVAIAEFDGHNVPNIYGHLPFTDLDPTKPAIKDGPANDYWDHVDTVVDAANARGITVAFLPTWGRYWHDKSKDGKPPIFNKDNAEVYGNWLGKRYKNKGIVWVLGGDRSVDSDAQKETIRAMAQGLISGDGTHIITFHPNGGMGSSKWFHDDAWLSFNMRQNGHVAEFTGRYDQTKIDYDRTPTKPVIDGEPIYEGHPVSFNAKGLGHSTAADVRRPLYWNLFSGACGHTYGHHSIWPFWKPGVAEINAPLMPWTEAIDEPGANQMIHGRRLIESRPFLTRIPDDSIIVTDRVATSVPGAGTRRFVATRDSDGTFAMVYVPIGRAFKVKMTAIRGKLVTASWYDPRTGIATRIGEYPNDGEREFLSPNQGELTDWVLVLDDAAKNYPSPGQIK